MAGKAGVDDGGDVRVLDPLIDSPDTSVVDDNNSVGAVGGHILDQLVAELIMQ